MATLKEMGLEQIEVTIQIIATPEKLDGQINGPDGIKLAIEKAVASALELSPDRGDKFRVNAFGWNFSPEETA